MEQLGLFGWEACRIFADLVDALLVAAEKAAIFLDQPPPADALDTLRGRADEQLALGVREIYVAYGAGMAGSKLVIPAAPKGTARNMNTVAKLVAMAQAR